MLSKDKQLTKPHLNTVREIAALCDVVDAKHTFKYIHYITYLEYTETKILIALSGPNASI